jgi:hypothetical protein
MPDSQVNQISVDLVSASNTLIQNDAITAAACVFSNWTSTCGHSNFNGPFNDHGSITLDLFPNCSSSLLSAWCTDSGNGYAGVVIQSAAGDFGASLAGIFVQGTSP